MNIIISGINGFLGRHLNKYFGKDHHLIGIDVEDGFLDGTKVYSSKHVNKIQTSIDYIILCHAAVASGTHTIPNELLFEVNIGVTETILEQFKNTPTTYISTASIYDHRYTITENTQIFPNNSYSISKYWAEHLVLSKPKTNILRLSSLYGISMKENTLIPNYVNQAIRDKVIKVWGDGSRLQNYVHLTEVAQIIELIIKKRSPTYGKIFLGVAKKEYSNLEIASIIASECDSKITFVNQDFSPSISYNNTKTQKILGWQPSHILKKELKTYIAWKLKK